MAVAARPTDAAQAARALARNASAPATLRVRGRLAAFRHLVRHQGFRARPGRPATVSTLLASLTESHAPSMTRRRLAALGKMHRFAFRRSHGRIDRGFVRRL
jgi:hypothetical protein